jgi:hypothetical protein
MDGRFGPGLLQLVFLVAFGSSRPALGLAPRLDLRSIEHLVAPQGRKSSGCFFSSPFSLAPFSLAPFSLLLPWLPPVVTGNFDY